MFKQFKVEADKLKRLIGQAAFHAPPTLDQVSFDQLVMGTILEKSEDKKSSTFVGQVILNALSKVEEFSHSPSPFVYCMSKPACIVSPPFATTAPSRNIV
ncbi:hypothetical protein O181_070317 [Austropuccinia psidii MF-1]|uniref:Uncharacterized protein n=1 Tax=Austropuccinia psidii MF-1 TaxID=1389203 RepID=A0A9Q3F2Z0_9BASI|nr:hypothetical protein [Austropuccinia psidii MF-1]